MNWTEITFVLQAEIYVALNGDNYIIYRFDIGHVQKGLIISSNLFKISVKQI